MSLTGPKAEVLRQQQPRLNFDSPPNRDSSAVNRDPVSALVPPTKSPFRLHNRFVKNPLYIVKWKTSYIF